MTPGAEDAREEIEMSRRREDNDDNEGNHDNGDNYENDDNDDNEFAKSDCEDL